MKKDFMSHFFDHIFTLLFLYRFKWIYERYKEVFLYLFFGGLSFLLNLSTFFLLNEIFNIHHLYSNAISWILCVLFQFYTNRVWVFQIEEQYNRKARIQFLRFVQGRIFTLVVEEVLLFVLIEMLHFSTFGVKIVAQIVVIILNYVISKKFVFHR